MATTHNYNDDLQKHDDQNPSIVLLTQQEWDAMFDAKAREWLGMSGDEFISKLRSGEIEDPDRTPVVKLALMMQELESPV